MANQHHLDLLRCDVAAWNSWRAQNASVALTFREADLQRADLRGAHFHGAHLHGAHFGEAVLGDTTFGATDLSGVHGLDRVRHIGPSTIGIDTLYTSRGKLPVAFLHGCGVPDTFIDY